MSRPSALAPLAGLCAIACLAAGVASQGLPPPPVPFENPITPAKAVLGKILYWDEQLSSDNTMSCGSCHRPGAGGADPRIARHPGFDGVFQTADDVLGSPGVVRSTASGDYAPHGWFGLDVQVTGRATPTNLGAAWVSTLRWDGRATETFIDPQSGQLRMMFGGALENHASGPPVNDAEMAYPGRAWAQIANKLGRVRPLALATNLPSDVGAELASNPDYGELMRRAFGDRTIDATRIIYALATYQRTLVPNQAPWDAYVAGNSSALTANQQAGLAVFQTAGGCARCHTPPLFSDGSFRNLGLRPVNEDRGWQLATLDPADRGKFKVPTLRNVGLRNRLMHNGRFATVSQVVDMYDQGGGAFTDNRDRLLAPLNLTPAQKAQLVDFVENGLTDPRVASESTPFDRPTLYAERAITSFGADHAGSGGFAPRALFEAPMAIGNVEFRLGVAAALGGALAVLALAPAAGPAGQQIGPIPIHIRLTPPPIVIGLTLSGSGSGAGHGTVHLPIPASPALLGAPLFHQWLVADPAAAGGLAASAGVGGNLF